MAEAEHIRRDKKIPEPFATHIIDPEGVLRMTVTASSIDSLGSVKAYAEAQYAELERGHRLHHIVAVNENDRTYVHYFKEIQ